MCIMYQLKVIHTYLVVIVTGVDLFGFAVRSSHIDHICNHMYIVVV